jgi:hypothetical protein
MLRRDVLKVLGSIPLTTFTPIFAKTHMGTTLYFSCSENNDLYRLATSSGISCIRFQNAREAVNHIPTGSVLLILAEDYPTKATQIDPDIYQEAAQKRLRLYVEFPSSLPSGSVGEPQRVALGKYNNVLERVVIASSSFAPVLERLHVLSLHECYYTPVSAQKPELVLARVVGYDTAIYGLPQEGVQPILFEDTEHNILVATTKLSGFIQSRYDPAEDWADIWNGILSQLLGGRTIVLRKCTPAVHPALGRAKPVSDQAELEAFRKGIIWYSNARLFVAPEWKHFVDEYAKSELPHLGPQASWQLGDGSNGVLEGFSSNIQWNGKQPVGWNLRADCAGETSMAMAFSGVIEDKAQDGKIAANLNDFIYSKSDLASGPRDDPQSPSFGLVGWSVPDNQGIYYGDDNARSLLGTMAAAALLKSDRWNEKVLRCLLANLRTTNILGFRPDSLTEKELTQSGWRKFYNDENFVNFHPHFEAYPWACFLRAYDKTKFSPFLDRTRTGIRMTMAAYPDQWLWTNGLQQERARMLLALAWLIRVEDKPEYRQWLRRIATDMLASQNESGGIREEIGAPEKSPIPPPTSNDKYGTSEEPLIQENGDPACDFLYTCNFAFLGLHEAAAATGDPLYREAEDKLARFLCRIQIESSAHPELAGGWFRAFDTRRWDYWASEADWGWGPWSIETGWTQAWICSVFAMRHLRTSLWEMTERNNLGAHLNDLVSVMFS